jgi:hypothetical protein
MPAQTDIVGVVILCAAVIGLVALLIYVGRLRYRAAHSKRKLALVSKVLIEYFRKTGVEVSVGCVSLQENNRFTAFVESEPMKQFRLSHIIEIALRDHVQKTCGLELDKIFWRFPIKVAARDTSPAGIAAGENKKIEGADDYINEGLVNYKDLPKFEATEIPWEKFEEASTQEPKKEESPADKQAEKQAD